jgi:hypothetical protein
MIVSLHGQCNVDIPAGGRELGEPLLRNLLEDGRVQSMQRPLEDCAIYLSVKDGSFLGFRREFRDVNSIVGKKG